MHNDINFSKTEVEIFINIHKDIFSLNSEYQKGKTITEKIFSYPLDNDKISIFHKFKEYFILSRRKNKITWSDFNEVIFSIDTSLYLEFLDYVKILERSNTIQMYLSIMHTSKLSINLDKFLDFICLYTIYSVYPVNLSIEKIEDSHLLLAQARKSSSNNQYNVALISMRSYIANCLKEWIKELELDNEIKDDNVKNLFGIINQYLVNKIQFKSNIWRKIISNLGKIIDEIQDVRNKQSVAHANDEVLSNFESKIIYESLEYLIWALNFIKKQIAIQNNLI
ncbi:hypothetical protein SSYRP_v1c00630 [Spiroplasma syrphidicola EA-1]|uniref:Abortive infection protein-like C-terminal domain-containing protein n=1 Tax=Spiroplasma syrphidicola EA-1 TaxID=1276229 RepID=R4UCR8_9MOLU|nr:abortive infection family protein [Spiroplasma syrphidicola]AGM25659.1 hypothetical protein SSYRP_v1c00630 [Spiroplasma syrphidicola EA-1]